MSDRSRLIVLAAVLLAACSSNNRFVMYDTDSGVTDIAPTTDGGGTTDVATADASADGSSMDASARDVPVGADQGPPQSCADGGLVCGATCSDPNTDPNNCGRCGNACAAGQICHVGFCVANPCPGNQYPCQVSDAGETACRNITTDVNNCGGCGVACPMGMECAGGACFVHCTAPLIRCGPTCSDTTSDALNCGACGNACGAGQTCMSSACTCAAPLTSCGTTCSNTATDAANCGGCGHACAAGSYCASSTCTPCLAPQTLCPAGVCTNTMTDPANCGGCGNACTGAAVCTAGACSCAAPGLTTCGATCTDTLTDPANCGGCGMACPSGMSCASGACGITTRYMAITSPPGVSFIDACSAAGAMQYLHGGLDASTLVPLPIAFRYWTTNIASGSLVNLTTSGWLGMNGVELNNPSGSLPTGGPPFAIIAPHWGFNDNGTPGQCVALVGAAPFRKWVVEWQNDFYFPIRGTTSLTYEVILSETSNTIDFVYGTMTGVRSQSAGLGDYTGAMSVGGCPGGGSTCAPASNSSVRFLPIP